MGHSTKALPDELKEKVRDLYLQGLRPEAIVANTGVKEKTMYTWIAKYNWNNQRLNLASELREMREKPLAFKLAEESRTVRKNLSKYLVESSRKLPRISSKSDVFKENQLGLQAMTKNASIVFGWESSDNKIAVNVSILGALGRANPDGKVIDVEAKQIEDKADPGTET